MTNNIKEFVFSITSPGSATGLNNVYTDYAVNGEILKVEWRSNDAAGIALAVSGTNEIIWSKADGSGNGFQIAYPVVIPTNNLNTALSGTTGMAFVPRTSLGILYVSGAAFEGGSLTNFHVYWR